MEQDTKITDNTEIKQKDHLFKKGESGNPAGRPKGSNNFETDFDEAVLEIAKENGMTRSEARKLLLKVAFKNAKEGNYSFYKDIHDRIYGQAQQKVEHSGNLIIQISEDIAKKYDIAPNTENNSPESETI